MTRYYSYLNTAKKILSSYDGSEPFASFIKKYFSENKKIGSKDRKQVSQLCYCYFRTGKSLEGFEWEERILTSLFLCSGSANELLEAFKPEWNKKTGLPVSGKLSLLGVSPDNIFPFSDEISKTISKEEFSLSHLQQPDLFLRLRPGKEEKVLNKIKGSAIGFKKITAGCLALPNATKIEELVALDDEAVVQDYSSQRVGELVQPAIGNRQSAIRVWDCCAGSGGKSIMLYDLNPGIQLTVSDKRETILINLKKRFQKAGIGNYKAIEVDLTNPTSNFQLPTFNFILADVPCSGSGTWGRTPEQLLYFKKEKISEYVKLQRSIISNITSHLQPGGYLLYSTCSVFEKENEGMVEFIKENLPAGKAGFHLDLTRMEIIEGYRQKADTMFAALLQKPL